MVAARQVKYPAREAERMLGALEAQIGDLRQYENETEYTVGSLNHDTYARFRAKTGEIYTLSIVVRTRLENLDTGAPDPALNERFDRATVRGQKIIIRTSLRFMKILSEQPQLPLGAREIFTGELRSLYDARERLRDPRLKAYIDEHLEQKIATAEAVLTAIIERAPRLLSFTVD